MKVTLIGIEKQDYILDNGYSFKGFKLHCADLETIKDGLVGNQICNLKIPDGSPFDKVPLEIGTNYIVYFNQKGRLDYFKQDK